MAFLHRRVMIAAVRLSISSLRGMMAIVPLDFGAVLNCVAVFCLGGSSVLLSRAIALESVKL